MLVFIDDSGDPGFKTDKGSSRFFIIALVIFDDDLEAERTSLSIKETRRTLQVSDNYKFKFNKVSFVFKKEFFRKVSLGAFRVRAIVVKKEKINSQRLQNNKENFYNYITMQVLKRAQATIKKSKFKFDKRGEKSLRNQLRVYLSNEPNNSKKLTFTDLIFVDSKQNNLIQLADMIAGSIGWAYSGKDNTFFKTLKSRKIIEDVWEFE